MKDMEAAVFECIRAAYEDHMGEVIEGKCRLIAPEVFASNWVIKKLVSEWAEKQANDHWSR